MLEHTQGWSTKHAGDSTGSVGAGVQTDMGEEGLQVGWKGQGWDEPSANMHQQWDEEWGAGLLGAETAGFWEPSAAIVGTSQVGQPAADLRDIFGGMVTGDSIHGAGRCL